MHIKQVDSDGRIILPQEYRRIMGIKPGSTVAMSLDEEKIEIVRYTDIDAVKKLIRKAIKSHYHSFRLPIAACDEEKIFSACGLDFLVPANAELSIAAKAQLECNYEYYCRDKEKRVPLMQNGGLMVRMMAPLRKDNKPIGAILIAGGAEEFVELPCEDRKSVTRLASLIQHQINTL